MTSPAPADRAEAAADEPEPALMTHNEAIEGLTYLTRLYEHQRNERVSAALDYALAALQAESGPNLQAKIDILTANLTELQRIYDQLDLEKCSFVRLYRAAERRNERLWRLIELLLDRDEERES